MPQPVLSYEFWFVLSRWIRISASLIGPKDRLYFLVRNVKLISLNRFLNGWAILIARIWFSAISKWSFYSYQHDSYSFSFDYLSTVSVNSSPLIHFLPVQLRPHLQSDALAWMACFRTGNLGSSVVVRGYQRRWATSFFLKNGPLILVLIPIK